MVNSFETNFIPQTIEKTPLADAPAQNFFGEWCRINDSIVPQFISREEWEQRSTQGILERNDQGRQTLFLPEDLHLWEAPLIMKVCDIDTYASRNPDKKEVAYQRMINFGKTLQLSAISLAKIESDFVVKGTKFGKGEEKILNEMRSIANDVIVGFYNFGKAIEDHSFPKKKIDEKTIENMSLTEEEQKIADRFFLNGFEDRQNPFKYKQVIRTAQKNKARETLGKDVGEQLTEEEIEEYGQLTSEDILNLRIDKASVWLRSLTREGYKADGEKPWETKVGPMQHLQDRTRRQVTKAVETPEREMQTAIFRRGVEKLVTKMKTPNWSDAIQSFLKEGYNLNLATDKVKLINTLEIPRLEEELEKIRQTGDVAKISAKELEIAKKIQKAVSSFPYKKGANNPSEMVETQFINCVGSSILGGELLNEVGIKYLHANLPEHSATVLITSEGKVYWQDFTPPNGSNCNYVEITSDMLIGNPDLKNSTNIPGSGLTIEFKNWKINNKKLKVNLFNPEVGLQCHILNNTGSSLIDLGRNKEAIKAYKQAIDINPEYASPYNGLGNIYREQGEYEEAIKAYEQAIDIDPEYAGPYNGLGNTYREQGEYEEAIKAYKQFIKLWNGDEYWIKRAQKIIENLQKEE